MVVFLFFSRAPSCFHFVDIYFFSFFNKYFSWKERERERACFSMCIEAKVYGGVVLDKGGIRLAVSYLL